MPQRRSRRRRWIVLALVLAIAAGLGIYAYRTYHASTDRLGEILDALPLPPGTTRTSEDADPAASPVTVTRTYRLPDDGSTSAAITAVLQKAAYRAVDGSTGEPDPARWTAAVRTPGQGALTVRPPGDDGQGGIDLHWHLDRLRVDVDDLAFPS